MRVEFATGNKSYTAIKNLSFAPEVDIVGSKLPVNQFECDIYTEDTIFVGSMVSLYDDLDRLWANYWLTDTYHGENNVLHIKAQSRIAVLDRKTLPAIMYSYELFTDVVDDVFSAFGITAYSINSSLNNVRIDGFCPEQTGRERLLMLCFSAGAYVQDFFSSGILINPIDETETVIPIEKIFWKPARNFGDYITAIKATQYSFSPGTPGTTDKYVTDGNNNHYIISTQDISLTNAEAPASTPSNEVSIKNVMLVNTSNASNILSNLALIYFNRMSVDFDCINNGEYKPGQLLTISLDDDTMISGYAAKMNFRFGLQARAKVELVAVEIKESGKLIIKYKYAGGTEDGVSIPAITIDRRVYRFAVGQPYAVQNLYYDISLSMYRYIFRPLNEQTTGTMTSGTVTRTEYTALAIMHSIENRITKLISVDEVELQTETDPNELNVDGIKILAIS